MVHQSNRFAEDPSNCQLDSILAQNSSFLVREQVSRFDQQLQPFGKSFALFGAGRLGRHVLAGLRRLGIEPRAFADNNPALWNQTVDGLRVLPPTEAADRFRHSALFIVTVYTSESVRQQLRGLNVTAASFPSLAWKYPEVFLPHAAVDYPHEIFRQADAARQGFAVWADDISRREYVAQLKWRTSLDPDVLPKHLPAHETYFPDGLISLKPDERFVDCGAYDGDTIRSFMKRQHEAFRHIVALEPDPDSFNNLQQFVRTLPEHLRRRFSLFPLAVGARRGTVRFNATGTMMSAAGSGEMEVNCTPLDEVLADVHPTFIKMDVEGAELEALNGARRVIERAEPMLAVCLYHKQDHLWQIPLFIRERSSRYRLFLRRHADECWELVCYAVPVDRLSF